MIPNPGNNRCTPERRCDACLSDEKGDPQMATTVPTFRKGTRVAWTEAQADPENGPEFDELIPLEGTVVSDTGGPDVSVRVDDDFRSLTDGDENVLIRRRWLCMPPHEHCTVCQNEGLHGFDRPHVMEGHE